MSHSLSAPANCSDPDLYCIILSHTRPVYEKRRMPSVDASCFKRALCFRKDDINRGRWYEQWFEPQQDHRGQVVRDALTGEVVRKSIFRWVSPRLPPTTLQQISQWDRERRASDDNGRKVAARTGGRSTTRTTTAAHTRAGPASSPGPSRPHGRKRKHRDVQSSPVRHASPSAPNFGPFAIGGRFFPYELLDSPTPAPKRLRCERSPSIEVIDPPSTVQLPIFSGAACLLAIAVLGEHQPPLSMWLPWPLTLPLFKMAEHIGSWLPHGINGSQLIRLLRRVGTDVRLSDAFSLDRLAITERRPILIFCHGATAPLEENDMFRPLAFEGKYLVSGDPKGKGRVP
ncbi:hypothetical protein K488DRAFT_75158 [Vararia minispora EC-137]|uniref:Uncharacterized protein n=1 Tax=Vararia minispora EC-137 TaxID=1314806 RepID=A0ACB8Q538_9AGAM|nr:hypothetical protein K488DRAFT_75158 [Vararia minispora EC-137]